MAMSPEANELKKNLEKTLQTENRDQETKPQSEASQSTELFFSQPIPPTISMRQRQESKNRSPLSEEERKSVVDFLNAVHDPIKNEKNRFYCGDPSYLKYCWRVGDGRRVDRLGIAKDPNAIHFRAVSETYGRINKFSAFLSDNSIWVGVIAKKICENMSTDAIAAGFDQTLMNKFKQYLI